VTLESEFVLESDLRVIEESGTLLYPSASTVGRIQDKLLQKRALKSAGTPIAPFADIPDHGAARAFGEAHGFPFVLKSRRGGYDGYGNQTVHSEGEIPEAWEQIVSGELRSELYAEAFVPFIKELAVMVVRGRDGEMKFYPVVETVQRDHICHIVTAPADIPEEVAARATAMAADAIDAIEGVGVFGVELFLKEDGEVLVNEIAPRPHNSGHYTIEGCVTSQFENHIRAVIGWPLGATDVLAPAVAMVNIQGDSHASGVIANYGEVLADPGVHLHLYGKLESRPGRKMGHVTVLAETVEVARNRAERAAAVVRFEAG
jgi:5-(carboxyamino)imidazole ribonucleotide synthase